ncbi:hypothetical protein B0H19DRAFT_228674 [Mycena capillaripes]|nr:hypothetical protein B0H19DRAFT_228674 [Mycena capillaripes]
MSHPIALPVAAHQDYTMDPGSYTGEDGRFNPASYTRHFLGSPISWRAGSFGAQFCPSQSPTAMLVGSYERSPVKSPQDSSILNAWNVFDRQGELCRNYTCCGTHLADLHALLEHFEEVHIVVKDRGQPPSIQIPFNPQMNPPDPEPPQQQSQPQYSTPFDTDDMDLGLDYDHASPPPPSTAPTSTVTSRAPSPSPSPPGSQRPALNISLNGVGFPFREGMHTPLSAARAPAPFSAYARYNAEYNSPGAVTPQDVADYTDPTAIAPALVFATGEELQGESPSPTSIVPAPIASTSSITNSGPSSSGGGKVPKASKRSPPPTSASMSAPPSRGATPGATLPTPPASAGASPSPATILLPHKPFRCPKPNCSKSYKQANGLKYHMTHGSCNYGPAKDLEAVRALLERKRANAAPLPEEDAEDSGTTTPAPSGNGGNELSQAELNEVEARVRPFACGVGDCARRYKNMNGLRYHYQHSGDHGAVGLSLLAGGLHGCLQQRQGSSAPSTPTTAPTSSSTAGANVAKGKTTSSYAWGSTLLPHIQAVATTATATTTAKGKTEATPFTPPTTSNSNSKSGSAPATPAPGTTSTFSATPATGFATTHATPDYLAQLQRAQYAQYQQWYAQAQTQAQAQGAPQVQQQVDVQMG